MMRALVVEDEPVAREYLIELLRASGRVEIVGAIAHLLGVEQQGYAELAAAIDVAFLDIRLGGAAQSRDGLTIARTLVAQKPAPVLVFVTASTEHAVEAMNLGGAFYLRKPYDQTRLDACLRRVGERLPPAIVQTPKRIAARSKQGIVFVDLDDVWAFETETRLVNIHTRHGVFDFDLSLAAVEQLMGPRFYRTHRSWLVQLEHMRAFEKREGESQVFAGESVDGRGIWAAVARDRAAELRKILLQSAVGLRT
jgi:two-component system, LytTR family, response regulator LytT